jgi:hypothetical protein
MEPRAEDQQEDRNKPGYGIDRTLIRRMLDLTPAERIEHAVVASRNVKELLSKMKLRER